MDDRKATVIISFYNNKKALCMIFQSLKEEKTYNFDVIVADDGSSDDITSWLKDYIKLLPFRVLHVWHEDKGFRKNRILNKSIAASKTDYLIFIDGDCVPQAGFVQDHLYAAEKGVVVCGRRVELSEKYTQKLYSSPEKSTFSHVYFIPMMFRYLWFNLLGYDTDVTGKHIENGIHIKFLRNLMLKRRLEKSIIGCNFSLFKDDFKKINGFDMNYEAPAVGEDTDIEFRLNGVGIKTKALKFGAALLHLYHQELKRPSINQEIFQETVKNKAFWANNGLDKL
ncbi:glycosyltransferase [Salinivibrio sp. PR919]|nr:MULTISPECIES: glycosyltransferase [unclassified Salinivibrio]OOF14967.1 hypothetical protein BZG83_04595 [Salinivibrio sp. PR919]OOF17431.1 hypothetical protein BZG84_07800 [Salinivibrio sp. PR932]